MGPDGGLVLLSVDPSLNSAGAAIFVANRLVACVRVQPAITDTSDCFGARCLDIATGITKWFASRYSATELVDFVFEWPQIYTAIKSKGDPNDLPPLAGIGMAVAAKLQSAGVLGRIFTPTPAEWIGQCPKVCQTCHGKNKKKCKRCNGSAWKTPRGIRIRDCLAQREIDLTPDQNDAIDAVGIGLHRSGRLVSGRVFAGAV